MKKYSKYLLGPRRFKRALASMSILLTHVFVLNINAKGNPSLGIGSGIEGVVVLSENLIRGNKVEAEFNYGSNTKVHELFGYESAEKMREALELLNDQHASMLSKIADLEARLAVENNLIPDGVEFNGITKNNFVAKTKSLKLTSVASSSSSQGFLSLPPAPSTTFLAKAPTLPEAASEATFSACENPSECQIKKTAFEQATKALSSGGIYADYEPSAAELAQGQARPTLLRNGSAPRSFALPSFRRSTGSHNLGDSIDMASYSRQPAAEENNTKSELRKKQEALDAQYDIAGLGAFLEPGVPTGTHAVPSSLSAAGNSSSVSNAGSLDMEQIKAALGPMPEGWTMEVMNFNGQQVVVRGALDKRFNTDKVEDPDNYYQVFLSKPMGGLGAGLYTFKKVSPLNQVCSITGCSEANITKLYDDFEKKIKDPTISSLRMPLPVVSEALGQIQSALVNKDATENFIRLAKGHRSSFRSAMFNFAKSLRPGDKGRFIARRACDAGKKLVNDKELEKYRNTGSFEDLALPLNNNDETQAPKEASDPLLVTNQIQRGS